MLMSEFYNKIIPYSITVGDYKPWRTYRNGRQVGLVKDCRPQNVEDRPIYVSQAIPARFINANII